MPRRRRIRSAADQRRPDRRNPRRGAGRGGASGQARQAGPRADDLLRVGADRGVGAIRGAGSAAGVRRAVRLYDAAELQGRLEGFDRGAPARRRRSRFDRRHGLPRDRTGAPGRHPGLVPLLRPLSGAPHRGQFQKSSCSARSASSRASSGFCRTARKSRFRSTSCRRATSSSSAPAKWCRSTASIVEGLAMIDQHALTGESTPAEKGVGDQCLRVDRRRRRQDARRRREIRRRNSRHPRSRRF